MQFQIFFPSKDELDKFLAFLETNNLIIRPSFIVPEIIDIFDNKYQVTSTAFAMIKDDSFLVSFPIVDFSKIVTAEKYFSDLEANGIDLLKSYRVRFEDDSGRLIFLPKNLPTMDKLLTAYKLSYFRDYLNGNAVIGELIERAVSGGEFNEIYKQVNFKIYPNLPFESKHQKSLHINNSLTPIEVLESICKEVCEAKEINGIASELFDYNRDGKKFEYIYNLFDNKVYTDTIIKPKVEILTVSPSVGGRILYSLLISIKATKDEIIKYIVRYISLVSGELLANLTDDNKYGLISVTRNSLYLLPCSITPVYTYDEDDVFEGENGVEVNFLINSRFFHEPFYVVIHLDDFLLNHEIIYHRNLNMVMKAVNTVYQKVEDLAEFLKHTF